MLTVLPGTGQQRSDYSVLVVQAVQGCVRALTSYFGRAGRGRGPL